MAGEYDLQPTRLPYPTLPPVVVDGGPWGPMPGDEQPGDRFIDDFTSWLHGQGAGAPSAAGPPAPPEWGPPSAPPAPPTAGTTTTPDDAFVPTLPVPGAQAGEVEASGGARIALDELDTEGAMYWGKMGSVAGALVGGVMGGAGRFGMPGLGGAAVGLVGGALGGFVGSWITGFAVGKGIELTKPDGDDLYAVRGALIGGAIGAAQLALAAAVTGRVGVLTALNPVFGAVGGAAIGSYLQRPEE